MIKTLEKKRLSSWSGKGLYKFDCQNQEPIVEKNAQLGYIKFKTSVCHTPLTIKRQFAERVNIHYI